MGSCLNADVKLYGFGFNKEVEQRDYIKYTRHNKEFNYDFVVEIIYDENTRSCKFSSYISDLYDSYKHPTESLTFYELEQFLEKMRVMSENHTLT